MDEKERKERIATESITMIRTPVSGDIPLEAHWFPINSNQIRDLQGKILTHLEMLNLPTKAEDATKAILKQMLWHWFDEAQENAVTSSKDCLAPVIFYEEGKSNRWGFKSLEDFRDQTKKTENK